MQKWLRSVVIGVEMQEKSRKRRRKFSGRRPDQGVPQRFERCKRAFRSKFPGNAALQWVVREGGAHGGEKWGQHTCVLPSTRIHPAKGAWRLAFQGPEPYSE